MCATQMMKTEVILNAIGYVMHLDPGPILMVVPRDTDGDTFSKDRLAPMLRDTPVLRGLVSDVKSRDSGNTILHKNFPGGHFTLTGAISPSGLAARPIRYLFCDEVDKYPPSAGTEGDPISLALRRTDRFWNRKIVLTCSPTEEGISRIDSAYKTSDQRRRYVPCPKCETFQRPRLESHVVWDDSLGTIAAKARSARVRCEHCGHLWSDVERWRADKKGRWVADAPFEGVAGFNISELFSPGKKLEVIVREFLEQKNNPQQLRTFVNTVLAETYKIKGEAPDWDKVFGRREAYDIGIVQRGGLFLTAGCDVQKDRIEVEIVAWGRGKSSWSVDYRIIPGDTSTTAPWDELEALLAQDWPTMTGTTLPIMLLAVDTGYRPQMAYKFCARHPNPAHGPAGSRVFAPRSVMPIKGDDNPFKLISSISTVNAARKRGGLKIVSVGGPVAKQELYDWLRLQLPEDGVYIDGYPHFPAYEREYFQGLCSEQRVVHDLKGRVRVEWVKKPEFRNEPLDCRVYARAAASVFGVDRFREKHWRELERRIGVDLEQVVTPVAEPPEEPAPIITAPLEVPQRPIEKPPIQAASQPPKPPQTMRRRIRSRFVV